MFPVAHADRCLGNGGERHAHAQVRPDEIKACLLGLLPEPQRVIGRVTHIHILGDSAIVATRLSPGASASASRLLTDAKVSARIEELQTLIAESVVKVEIRQRSARVEVLENNLNRMCSLIEARALEYADHPGGATGMLVKDYRGKNAEQEIWKLDAALLSQINATMKQAAIEEGHPERFVRKPPQPLPAPREVWINKPQQTPENKTQ